MDSFEAYKDAMTNGVNLTAFQFERELVFIEADEIPESPTWMYKVKGSDVLGYTPEDAVAAHLRRIALDELSWHVDQSYTSNRGLAVIGFAGHILELDIDAKNRKGESLEIILKRLQLNDSEEFKEIIKKLAYLLAKK